MKKMLRDALVLALIFVAFVSWVTLENPFDVNVYSDKDSDIDIWIAATSRYERIKGPLVRDLDTGVCYEVIDYKKGAILEKRPCEEK